MNTKLLLSGVAAAVLGMIPCQANTTNPVIFNITESVKPGQVIGIQGENFGTNPQVWMQVVTSSATPTPTTQVTNILTKSNQYVAAEIPASTAKGLYAVFVKNTTTNVTSAYKFVNKARGLGYLDLGAMSTRPSEQFRIYGRNLAFSGVNPTVKFRDTSTSAVTNAIVPTGQTNPYVLTVTAPATIVAGQSYEILINNGYGSTNGDSTAAENLGCYVAGTDSWNLGTAWAPRYNYLANEYNIVTGVNSLGRAPLPVAARATGNGVTNDTAAIQAAINFASTDVYNGVQGAVLYFPAGTYIANETSAASTIIMKNYVTLRGAGRDVTKIYDNVGGTGSFFDNTAVCNYYGVADITIESGPTGKLTTWSVGRGVNPNNPSNWAFMIRSRFVNYRKAVLIYGSSNMLIDGCDIIHKAPSGKSVIDFSTKWHVIIRNSFIHWTDGRVDIFSGAKYLQLENNTFSRSVSTAGGGSGYGGPSLSGDNNVAILNNTFDKYRFDLNGNYVDGTNGSVDTPLPPTNDGETLLNENSGWSKKGHATSATDTTLTDSSQALGTNSYAGREVVIIQGKGLGQSRVIASNTATTLTLATPWDVNPDSSSYYTIVKYDTNYLCKSNLLKDVPRGIWLCYGGTMRDVAIVGNSLIDGNGIYLRGDSRNNSEFPQRINVLSNIVVEANTLSNTKKWYPANIIVTEGQSGGTELTGCSLYNIVVRDNSITIPVTGGSDFPESQSNELDGYFCKGVGLVDDDTTGLLGVIFDHNTANNFRARPDLVNFGGYNGSPYMVNTESTQTVIFNSINNNVDQVLNDRTMVGASHASIDTVLAWTPTAVAPPYVSVNAIDPIAIESTGSVGTFRFSRTGTSGNLVVSFALGGTAVAGDYSPALGSSVTIPSGASFADVTITPVNDGVVEGKESLSIRITASVSYQVGNSGATIDILDQPEYIVDNADSSGVNQFGGWLTTTSTGGYYGSNYLSDDNVLKGSKSVRFTPTLEQGGTYQVYARWTSFSNRADNVPIDITYSGGVDHVQVNQKLTGGAWILLGTYSFSAGTAGNVVISNTATNGYVVADAVRFLQLAPPPDIIMDNTDSSGITKVGTWTAATTTAGYYGSNYWHDGNTGQGTKSVKYTPTIPTTGTYQVYARWTSFSNRATNAHIAITHAGGTANMTVNQTTGGGAWVLLGTYTFNAGTAGNLLLSTTAANGYVVADAVRFLGQ